MPQESRASLCGLSAVGHSGDLLVARERRLDVHADPVQMGKQFRQSLRVLLLSPYYELLEIPAPAFISHYHEFPDETT
ncbi:MAG: hypothetical protein VB050_14370 [Geobacteraceae bacterium]|nr:hypothetical protein [Geobacteraceae bacterium]